MTNNVSLKSKKAQKTEPTLLEELRGPLRDFVQDFKTHGADVLQRVRQDNPEKYLELSTKLLPLVAAFNTGSSDFSSADSMQDLGASLLRSIGFHEPDEDSIQQAIEAQNAFVAALQRIYQCAQASEEEIH